MRLLPQSALYVQGQIKHSSPACLAARLLTACTSDLTRCWTPFGFLSSDHQYHYCSKQDTCFICHTPATGACRCVWLEKRAWFLRKKNTVLVGQLAARATVNVLTCVIGRKLWEMLMLVILPCLYSLYCCTLLLQTQFPRMPAALIECRTCRYIPTPLASGSQAGMMRVTLTSLTPIYWVAGQNVTSLSAFLIIISQKPVDKVYSTCLCLLLRVQQFHITKL